MKFVIVDTRSDDLPFIHPRVNGSFFENSCLGDCLGVTVLILCIAKKLSEGIMTLFGYPFGFVLSKLDEIRPTFSSVPKRLVLLRET